MSIHLYTYLHVYIYICISINREGDREQGRNKARCILPFVRNLVDSTSFAVATLSMDSMDMMQVGEDRTP